MRIYKLDKMVGGWFIGNFKPSVLKTNKFEVSYKVHKKNEKWPYHYHNFVDEYNLVVKGKMKIRGKILSKGDIFHLRKKELADPIFLKTTHIVCVKVPSRPNDKIIINNK